VERESRLEAGPIRFRPLPRDLSVPQDLLDAMSYEGGLREEACVYASDCVVLGADLDRDGGLEFCLLVPPNWWQTICYARGASRRWEKIGSLAYR
jgi:hypothetical protein